MQKEYKVIYAIVDNPETNSYNLYIEFKNTCGGPMARLSLHHIKRENARLVLEAISRKKYITKLEISEETGLSLMTVGKLVSALYKGGIISKGMSDSQKVGRRAEIFRIRHDWLIPIIEISGRVFKFIITDLEGTVIDKLEYRCSDEPMYISNEFVSFLNKTLEILKSKYKHKKALGIGIAICGIYDADKDRIVSSMIPELSSLKIMHNITKIFKMTNVVIDNANRLAAAGLIEGTENFESKTISCLTVNDSIECTSFDKGKYISGSNNVAGRLGDLPYSLGTTFANYMRIAQNVDDVYSPVVDLLKTIVISYDPELIYLISDKFVFYPQIKDRIYYSLVNGMLWPNDKRPELIAVNSNTLESVSAIISRVIGNWLDKLLEEKV